MRVVEIMICVAIASVAGCRGKEAKLQAATPAKVSEKPVFEVGGGWQSSTQLPSRAEPTVVRQGPAPLVYLVEATALVRVRDEDAKLDLARSYAAGRSFVRVDARRGVIYGEDTLVPGPLPADHRYTIYVDPTGENVARQGTFQPRPRKNP
jgi:hypothetical protein